MTAPDVINRPPLTGDANVSIDVDALNCYRRIHGLDERTPNPDGDILWRTGIWRVVDLLAEFDLSATFFVVGRDLEESVHRRWAQELVDRGHEVANHTYDHRYDLRHLPEPELAYQIEAADRVIEDATGRKPVGFRTPGYNVNADIIAFSRRAGHRYDASVFPCISYWIAKAAVMQWRKLRGDESGSSPTDPHMLWAPEQPYFPDPIDCWKPAENATGYVEIPMASAAMKLFPVIGTSLHLMDLGGIERLWPWIDRRFRPFFSLEMHAIDFIDVDDLAGEPDASALAGRQPDLRISWEQKRDRYRRIFALIEDTRDPVTLEEATADAISDQSHSS